MRNDPRHAGARRVLIEVGQGVVIGIEQVRCDIGSITASENRKVDHRGSSNVEIRDRSACRAQGFLYFERPRTQRHSRGPMGDSRQLKHSKSE